jgi:hypothetical protein
LINRSGRYGSAFPSIGVATFQHKHRIGTKWIESGVSILNRVISESYAFPDIVSSDEESVKPEVKEKKLTAADKNEKWQKHLASIKKPSHSDKTGPQWDPNFTEHRMDHRYKLPGCEICQKAQMQHSQHRAKNADLGEKPTRVNQQVTGDHFFLTVEDDEYNQNSWHGHQTAVVFQDRASGELGCEPEATN